MFVPFLTRAASPRRLLRVMSCPKTFVLQRGLPLIRVRHSLEVVAETAESSAEEQDSMPTLSDWEVSELHDLSLSHSLCVSHPHLRATPSLQNYRDRYSARPCSMRWGSYYSPSTPSHSHRLDHSPPRLIYKRLWMPSSWPTRSPRTPPMFNGTPCTSPPPPFSHFERVMQAVHLDRLRLYEIPFPHQDGRNQNRFPAVFTSTYRYGIFVRVGEVRELSDAAIPAWYLRVLLAS